MSVPELEKKLYNVESDRVVISYDDDPGDAFISISNSDIMLVSSGGTSGVKIMPDGITIQGDLFISGSGTAIKKGEYSENPKSARIFTYTETISIEGDIKEKLAEAAGKIGVNTGELTQDGIVPLMTNIGGYPPHLHTMMFDHVHRVEPAYLYRIPSVVRQFSGILSLLKNFLGS